MIEFKTGTTGPCTRCRGDGGELREILSITSRSGNGFTVERVYCDTCAAAALEHEQRLTIAYQELIDLGNTPAAACGLLLAQVTETLSAEARAA